MKVRMRVQNPNDRVLPIKGLSYTLEVAGTELANGVSAASFRVPAFGEAEFDMNVTANMISIITQLMSRKDGLKQADEVPYRLVGKVQLSEGLLRTIPFEEKGSFKLR
jgi:LEA14-like dessication related protein